MATRKDQLDAFNFARRRMVANLVVPTATGSDEGAPRPVRTFATSIILSAIAVAAVAVLGVFKPSAPTGWQAGLAVDSNTGAAYVDQSNELHAVYNITSARLILGTKFQKFDVPDSTLNNSGIPIGSQVGILGAPADVPSASNMTLKQWTLCQHESDANDEAAPGGNTYLEIGYWPTASDSQPVWNPPGSANANGASTGSNDGLIVHDTANDVYLVDGDYKYYIGNSQTQSDIVTKLLAAVNQNKGAIGGTGQAATGFWVSDAWLSAFSDGAPIQFPQIADGTLGSRVSGVSGVQPGQTVGQYDQNFAGGGSVQTDKGLVQLSTFAYDLYIANKTLTNDNIGTMQGGVPLQPSAVSAANPGSPPSPSSVFGSTYGVNWPAAPPNLHGLNDVSEPTEQDLCVGYEGLADGSVPALTTWTSANLLYGTAGSAFGLTQTTSSSEANVVLVKPGFGLLATRSTSGSNQSGYQYLIEDSGFRYALATDNTKSSSGGQGSSVAAKDQLGYHSVSPETVPQNWVDLIQGGATLDPNRAGAAPVSGQ